MSFQVEKAKLRDYCEAFRRADTRTFEKAARRFLASDAEVNIVHPFNELAGADAYVATFLDPLQQSFRDLRRSDYMAFAGTYDDATWVTCTGYYSGHFHKPWCGIEPSGALAHLRFGEFHRMEDGQATKSFIYLDIPELMIACDQWPIADSPGKARGFTGFLPGPATQDGLVWHDTDPTNSASSYRMVTDMLRSLATEDEAWRPYWSDDMVWYGPAAFGSFVGIEDFADFQVPFEQTFTEWIGGSVEGSQTRHFTRFADGDYVCSGGWPSLNAVQAKTFLGQPSQGKRLYMRVSDWWRREGDKLVENWVFVDIPHVLRQMGYDLFKDGTAA